MGDHCGFHVKDVDVNKVGHDLRYWLRTSVNERNDNYTTSIRVTQELAHQAYDAHYL